MVPPNQAVIMHEALAKRGVPTALVMFAGEQHGFRSAPNIRAAMDGELYFYGKARDPNLRPRRVHGLTVSPDINRT